MIYSYSPTPIIIQIIFAFIFSSIAFSQNVESPLPPAFSGIAINESDFGPDEGWIIGSKIVFQTSKEWETSSSALYHGKDLGYSTTDYIYSSDSESFRYNLTSGMKSVGLLPKNILDQSPFLTPQRWYGLLDRSDKTPIETLDTGLVIYKVKDPADTKSPAYIAIDPETNQIQWAETRFDDEHVIGRFSYKKWTAQSDRHSVPMLVEYKQYNMSGIRAKLQDIKIISDLTPPEPMSLGDNYTVSDFRKMKTYDAKGKELGPIQTLNAAQSSSKSVFPGIKLQTLITAAGVLLVVVSGALIAKRRMGTP